MGRLYLERCRVRVTASDQYRAVSELCSEPPGPSQDLLSAKECHHAFRKPLQLTVTTVTVVTLCHTPHIHAVSRCDDPWREVRVIVTPSSQLSSQNKRLT